VSKENDTQIVRQKRDEARRRNWGRSWKNYLASETMWEPRRRGIFRLGGGGGKQAFVTLSTGYPEMKAIKKKRKGKNGDSWGPQTKKKPKKRKRRVQRRFATCLESERWESRSRIGSLGPDLALNPRFERVTCCSWKTAGAKTVKSKPTPGKKYKSHGEPTRLKEQKNGEPPEKSQMQRGNIGGHHRRGAGFGLKKGGT